MDKRFGAAKNLNAFVDEAAEGIDYITDQQNTINASYKGGNVTDEQHFSPYGKPVTFTLPEGTELTKFAYTGRNYDAPADLYYYRGRYYDACSARFLNPDPSENGMNWTGYVSGDPVNMVDPSGYDTVIRKNNREMRIKDNEEARKKIERILEAQKGDLKRLLIYGSEKAENAGGRNTFFQNRAIYRKIPQEDKIFLEELMKDPDIINNYDVVSVFMHYSFDEDHQALINAIKNRTFPKVGLVNVEMCFGTSPELEPFHRAISESFPDSFSMFIEEFFNYIPSGKSVESPNR
jgi:RHS repeat-associated protein